WLHEAFRCSAGHDYSRLWHGTDSAGVHCRSSECSAPKVHGDRNRHVNFLPLDRKYRGCCDLRQPASYALPSRLCQNRAAEYPAGSDGGVFESSTAAPTTPAIGGYVQPLRKWTPVTRRLVRQRWNRSSWRNSVDLSNQRG